MSYCTTRNPLQLPKKYFLRFGSDYHARFHVAEHPTILLMSSSLWSLYRLLFRGFVRGWRASNLSFLESALRLCCFLWNGELNYRRRDGLYVVSEVGSVNMVMLDSHWGWCGFGEVFGIFLKEAVESGVSSWSQENTWLPSTISDTSSSLNLFFPGGLHLQTSPSKETSNTRETSNTSQNTASKLSILPLLHAAQRIKFAFKYRR